MNNENIETNKALAEKFINRYTLAVENGKKYAWKIAEVIYTTVNHKDFEKAFASQHDYAAAIGFSDSKISKAITCYEKHLYINEYNKNSCGRLPEFSLGQIEETAKIEIEEMQEFVSDTKVNESTTIKDMRKAVKDWLHRNDTTEESEAKDEETAVEDINNAILCTFNYNNFYFESSSAEVAEKIKKFIKDNFLNI